MPNYKVLNFRYCALLAYICLLTVACIQESQSDSNQSADQAILQFMEESGFRPDDLKIEDDVIYYQEDVVFNKDRVIYDMEHGYVVDPDEDLADAVIPRQRGVKMNNALSKTNCEKGVKLWLAPSILSVCGPKVRDGFLEAAAEINAITNLGIAFSFTPFQHKADVFIAADSDCSVFASADHFCDLPVVMALAEISNSGRPGRYISVHPGWESFSPGVIKSGMMHELCHIIGLLHTGDSDDNGVHIHGTPQENSTSIMNPTSQYSGEFSNYDKKALRMYYAKNLSTPGLEVTSEGNTVALQFTNTQKLHKPYYWIRLYRYDTDGKLNGHKTFRARSNNQGVGTIYWKNQPEGTYIYKVKGMRFRRDVRSPISAGVEISIVNE